MTTLLYQDLLEEIEQVAKDTKFYEAIPVEMPLQEKRFPVEALPEPLRRFAVEASRSLVCPVTYIVLPMLSVVAGAIGATRKIQLKRDWLEPMILWTGIIGESGTIKSPAWKLTAFPLEEIQRLQYEKFEESQIEYERELVLFKKAESDWSKQKNSDDPPPEKPEPIECKRCKVSDITVEALVPILKQNPRGVFLDRDELSGWFGSFDQYKGGKSGTDAASWLSIWSMGAISVDRKTGSQKFLYVPAPAISITGGIQPEIFRQSMNQEHRDSGLAARFLFTFPARMANSWTDHEIDQETKDAYARLVEKLSALDFEIDQEGKQNP